MIENVRGFAFPFRIGSSGGIAWASEHEKIRQNIRMILSTRIGERVMLRDYGTRIPGLVHEPNDDVLADVMKTQAREALMRWEPRVAVTSLVVERREGELTLRLGYQFIDRSGAEELVVPIG